MAPTFCGQRWEASGQRAREALEGREAGLGVTAFPLCSSLGCCSCGTLPSVCLTSPVSQVLQWRQRSKPVVSEPSAPKKQMVKVVEKAPTEVDTVKLIEPRKEAKAPIPEECPEVAETYVLANTMDETEMEPAHKPPSLLRLPQTAVQSVSALMFSALQSGWQLCRWKAVTWEAEGAVDARGGMSPPDPENRGRPSCRKEGEVET